MGERKGVNKYYPPDFDPSKGSLNTWLGSHPLRDRARKLHKGILVIRFEMPYNIWCDGCNNHIGMGVRYNAEKSKVGNYYTTPIYKFRMKCHLCDNHFEIQTDPKNHDYVILTGARRKEQRWDPRENEQIVPEDKATQKKLATDPMYKLEHGSDDQQRGKVTNLSVAQIEDIRGAWNDDYILNKMARNKFREEKKQIAATKAADKALLEKSSLDIELVPEDETDQTMAGLMKYSVTKSFDEKQREKRKAIEARPLFSKVSAGCTITPKSDGSFDKRAEIKLKLGLHLSSAKVDHTLAGPSMKGLVKRADRTAKSTDAHNPASVCTVLPKEEFCPSVKDPSFFTPEGSEQDTKADHKEDSAVIASPDTSTVNGCEASTSVENDQPAVLDKADISSKESVKHECTDTPSASILHSAVDHIDENLSVDNSSLAALMASYSGSDSNSSDDGENV